VIHLARMCLKRAQTFGGKNTVDTVGADGRTVKMDAVRNWMDDIDWIGTSDQHLCIIKLWVL
jgi:hypothetical protein